MNVKSTKISSFLLHEKELKYSTPRKKMDWNNYNHTLFFNIWLFLDKTTKHIGH